MVPTFGVKDHSTPLYAAPCTVAVNIADWPAVSVLGPGAIEMLTGRMGATVSMGWASNTVAVAVLAGFARLVAEIVICASLKYPDGAV